MRKLISKNTLMFILMAVMMTVILVVSCSRKDNPLSFDPNNSNGTAATNLMGPGDIVISPAFGSKLTALDMPIYITFDRYLNPSSVNSTTITIKRITNTSEIPVEIEIQYMSGPHLAKITPSDFEFEDNSAFILTLTNGIEDPSGAPFDGNGNGVADSVQYDVYRSTFYTGTGNANLPDIISPLIDVNSIHPTEEASVLEMDSSQFWITVGFTASDIDTSLLTNSTIRIYDLGETNTGATDTAYVPNLLAVALKSGNSVTYRLRSAADTTKLFRGNRYQIEFIASAITDTSGNPLLWGNEVNDGSIASYNFGFIMEPFAGEDITPPDVANFYSSYIGESWLATIIFNENTLMDTTTFNNFNISFYDSNKTRLDGYYLKEIQDNWVVFYPRLRSVMPTYYFVATAVADTAGNMLDGNNNGIGGEPEDCETNLPPGP